MRGLVQIVFGLVIGVVGAAWAGPAQSMLAPQTEGLRQQIVSTLGEGWGQPVPLALTLAGLLYVLTGIITMILSGVSGLFASGAARRKAARRLDLFHELLTGATVRMVGTDGKIEHSEMSMVSGVLEKFGQTPIAEKTIRSISESFVKDPDKYLKLMAEKSKDGGITGEQKEHILRACLLVALADVSSHASELQYLNDVATALNVPPETLSKIRDDMTKVTQKLVSVAAFAA